MSYVLTTMRNLFPGHGETWLHYDAFHLEAVQAQIKQDGFAIVHNLVPLDIIATIRKTWPARFTQEPNLPRVTWAPSMGQANTIGFTDDAFQCLYRSCEFLWNATDDQTTREVCIRLHALRNLICHLPPLTGLLYAPNRYGIFITTSYYPPGKGWLEFHADGVATDIPLLHHIVPLTIKGVDYQQGGLAIINRQGKEIDVDAQMPLGSVLFYDGALKHGVRMVQGGLGRLQMFGIPTTFVNPQDNVYWLSTVRWRMFLKAKAMALKNRCVLAMGLSQVIR